jgi:hypothetical protein
LPPPFHVRVLQSTEILVPMRFDIDIKGVRLVDSFTWNM